MSRASLRFSAVLLAAGESRRMGSANKLLLPLDGEALVVRALRTLSHCGFTELVVVLGHEAEVVHAALAPLAAEVGASLIRNMDYRDGQMSSVNCGVRALRQAVDGIVVCPADLPLIEADDIERLLEAFGRLDGGRTILVPTFANRRGNPIVMSYAHREAIVAGHNLGCRQLIDRHPDIVATLAMPNPNCVTDLDTPDDYASFASALPRLAPALGAEGAGR